MDVDRVIPLLVLGAMLSLGCGGPRSFVAEVDNRTDEPQQVRIKTIEDKRESVLTVDLPPRGTAVCDVTGYKTSAEAELGEQRRPLDRDRPRNEISIVKRNGRAVFWPRGALMTREEER
jgi:hypothetical protein